jgi:hypothetical protein
MSTNCIIDKCGNSGKKKKTCDTIIDFKLVALGIYLE